MAQLAAAGKPEEALLLARRTGNGVPADLRTDWQQAVRDLDPKVPQALENRVAAAAAADHPAEVAAALAIARELGIHRPEWDREGTQAGWELWRQGDRQRAAGQLAEAEQSYRQSLQATVDDYYSDDARFYLALILQSTGHCPEAMTHARQVIDEHPLAWWYHDDALLVVGQCQQVLGQADAARANYQEILARYPNTSSAVVARQALDR